MHTRVLTHAHVHTHTFTHVLGIEPDELNVYKPLVIKHVPVCVH